jgi:leucyl/phenylalanyl-tRNA--protein transferase
MTGTDIIGLTRTLTAEMAVAGYRRGIFPMAMPRLGVVTWHRPEPRAILPLDGLHVSRSLRRTLRKGTYSVTFDRAFAEVMRGCAEGRPVWIGPEFHRVYGELHRRGQAHSVEVWREDRLAGGLYGVQLGGAFFAESKFHSETDASKVALVKLVERLRRRGFTLLDVQYLTPHLAQFGVIEIPHRQYLRRLTDALALDRSFEG